MTMAIKSKENEMGVACNTHRRDDTSKQIFDRENRKENNLRDTGVNWGRRGRGKY
jgi:hypothetical protein